MKISASAEFLSSEIPFAGWWFLLPFMAAAIFIFYTLTYRFDERWPTIVMGVSLASLVVLGFVYFNVTSQAVDNVKANIHKVYDVDEIEMYGEHLLQVDSKGETTIDVIRDGERATVKLAVDPETHKPTLSRAMNVEEPTAWLK